RDETGTRSVVHHGGRTRRVMRRLEFEILLKVKGVTGISNRRKHRLEIWGNLRSRAARSMAPNSPNRILPERSLEALARERRSGRRPRRGCAADGIGLNFRPVLIFAYRRG